MLAGLSPQVLELGSEHVPVDKEPPQGFVAEGGPIWQRVSPCR